jgi:lipase ATG15
MKISLFLQNIFTSSFLLKRPNIYSQNNSNIGPFEFDLPDQTTTNTNINYDLPINYNTIKNMMLMSYNAYMEQDNSKWEKVDYNLTEDISTSPNDIKGYLFSDETKTHNVVAIKGTSISFIPMFLSTLNSTIPNDKFNDNLFFSCCFYKESKILNNFCTDDSSKNECKKLCYKESLDIEKNYINMLPIIINNIKKVIDFENSNVYFTGHSLGGFLSVLLGLQYDKQVITFDSPGGKHYLDLSGINYSSKDNRIYHFGHNADSIMHGHCGSLCWSLGYNIETKCRVGNSCIYDSKSKLGLSDSIRTHQLSYLMKNILPHLENDFPECIYHEECAENCDKWTYI